MAGETEDVSVGDEATVVETNAKVEGDEDEEGERGCRQSGTAFFSPESSSSL